MFILLSWTVAVRNGYTELGNDEKARNSTVKARNYNEHFKIMIIVN